MMRQSKVLYNGLWALDRELAKPEWEGSRYTILLDENTFQHCLPRLMVCVDMLQEAEFVEVPAGEDCKTIEVAAQVWRTLLENGADRSHVLVCLGGGSVCDLGGFVAAGYKRGIRHINVPTTLLAMVDAAIGGKTAIDFGGVKNSIGHFYPAALTVVEPGFQETLSLQEIHCGVMEMVKTAAVTDAKLYRKLISRYYDDEMNNTMVTTVARLKNRVVKADPYDQGVRKILNFGHTFGHAIEVYWQLPHGIAVGIGMRVAMYLSMKKVGFNEEVYNTYAQWLNDYLSSFSSHLSPLTLKDIEQMLPLMHQDKKSVDGELRCVLLQEPGAAMIDIAVSDNEVRDALLHLK